MRIRERYELAEELGPWYRRAKRSERGAILDGFCLATGYERKYAIRVLRGRRRLPPRQRARRARKYGLEFRRGLKVCWEAADYLCAERLQPFLPDLLLLLRRHGQLDCSEEVDELISAASISTVERTLHDLRRGLVARRMAQTKPGGLLRRQIPVVVGQWQELDTPGYLEIDLVSHSGELAVGDWIWTLCATDLSSGWTERMPVMGKGQTRIVAALERIRQQLPFPMLGLHPDNGSEFLNWHLVRWCHQSGVALSRSRPRHKNDNCHVEQKNWTLVRRLIGYQRLDTPSQLQWLDALYNELLRPFNNCFQPVMKLVGKQTVGPRVRRLYDRPTTPLRRVLASGLAEPAKVQELVQLYTSTSPLTLKRQIDRRLAAMPAALEVHKSA
ncbi:MAG: transposase [Candidatus Dormibacteria bacterium]